MISFALFAFAIHQDSTTFRFQPKVGEKYRYAVTMEDEKGVSPVPSGAKSFGVYKIAGFKDGKYTIHEFREDVNPEGKSNTSLLSTYRLDSMLNCELISSHEESDAGLRGAKMAGSTIGCFGILFSPNPMKEKESVKFPFDALAVINQFIPPIPDEANPKIEASGDRTVTLEKIIEKIAFFKSGFTLSATIEADDKGQRMHASIVQTFDQTASINSDTGMPIKVDRKFSLSIKSGDRTNSMAGTVHWQRVP